MDGDDNKDRTVTMYSVMNVEDMFNWNVTGVFTSDSDSYAVSLAENSYGVNDNEIMLKFFGDYSNEDHCM